MPTIKPAVAEKTFPDIFVREMIITCDPNTTWRASIIVQPYNYETNEVDDDANPQYVNINDLKAEAAKDQEVGLVMATLLSIINKKLNPPVEEPPVEEPPVEEPPVEEPPVEEPPVEEPPVEEPPVEEPPVEEPQ
jgi:hypothetical protein